MVLSGALPDLLPRPLLRSFSCSQLTSVKTRSPFHSSTRSSDSFSPSTTALTRPPTRWKPSTSSFAATACAVAAAHCRAGPTQSSSSARSSTHAWSLRRRMVMVAGRADPVAIAASCSSSDRPRSLRSPSGKARSHGTPGIATRSQGLVAMMPEIPRSLSAYVHFRLESDRKKKSGRKKRRKGDETWCSLRHIFCFIRGPKCLILDHG